MNKMTIQILYINNHKIIRIPKAYESSFSTRGMTMIKIKVNQETYNLPLEPDGYGCHWFEWPDDLETFDEVSFEFEESKEWYQPDLAEDILSQLINHSLINQWEYLTVKAKWSWIRWVNFTENKETRIKRINTMMDMLSHNKKRPCCFDHSRSTVNQVSKSGKLLI